MRTDNALAINDLILQQLKIEHVNRIAEYFNDPTWELILNEDPIYPVKFKFQFSLKFVK